ncbi:DUF1707 SHOCT-like domain-containing protein [Agromyces soli]
MTDYANPDRPEERLSTSEREAAVDRLSSAQIAGRITPQEFGERSAAARAAVTRGDLVPLFADLPAGEAGEAGAPAAAGAASAAYGATAYPAAAESEPVGDDGWGRAGRPLGGAVGATIMALVPFIALALFFLTGFNGGWAWAWVWFVLIPVAGIIIYGPGSTHRDRRR